MAQSKSLVGINLDAPSDSSPQRPFINLIKSGRRFGSPTKPESADGVGNYPVGGFGQVLWTEGAQKPGDFILTGKANTFNKFSLLWGGNITLTKFDPATKNLEVRFSITGNQCAYALDGLGWQDLDIRRIENTNVQGFWNPEFLALVKAVAPGFIRFMDFTRTNNSTLATLANRPQIGSFTWVEGVPFEVCMDLCNVIGCDYWINVPALIGRSEYAQLGDLIKANLKSDKLVYTEYSNEVWNGKFEQSRQNAALTSAELATVGLYDPVIKSEPNGFYQQYMRVASQAVSLAGAIGAAIGIQNVRGIVATQIANPVVWQAQLRYLNLSKQTKGIWGLAGAPYYGNIGEFMSRTDLKVDDFFGPYTLANKTTGTNYFVDRAVNSIKNSTQFIGDAKAAGLVAVMYEGGKDTGDYRTQDPVSKNWTTNSGIAKIQASQDPRMTPVTRAYYDAWFAAGGGPAAYFVVCSRYDRFTWGATWDAGIVGPILTGLIATANDHRETVIEVDLKIQVTDLQKQLAAASDQIKSLQAQLADSQNQVTGLKVSVNTLTGSLAAVTTERDDCKKRLDAIRAQLL